jgi:hypothetical protein
VPTTGQLARDVILVLRIEDPDLDDVLYDAVTIAAVDTLDNVTVADLVDDINAALADPAPENAIWRYQPGDPLALLHGVRYFADYLTAEERDGVVVLVGTHDFKVKSASRNVTLLGMTAGVDLEATFVFFNAPQGHYWYCQSCQPVTLGLEIEQPVSW